MTAIYQRGLFVTQTPHLVPAEREKNHIFNRERALMERRTLNLVDSRHRSRIGGPSPSPASRSALCCGLQAETLGM